MKKIILISLAIFCVFSAKAQYGTSVEMNPDARAAGMANSTIAGDASAFSIFGNTAAISFSDYKWAVSGAFDMELGNNFMDAFAGYYRINSKHSVALGIRHFNQAEYEITEDGVSYTTVRPYDAIIDLGYTYAINGLLSVGANLRGVQSTLTDKAALAYGFDAGAYFRKNAWSAALTVNNIGTKMDYYKDGGESMPASVNAGGQYRFDFADKHRITANLQLGYRFLPSSTSYFGGGAGLEYMYDNFIAVRGGYRIGDETRTLLGDHATVGCGVYLGPVVLDFAWIFLLNDTAANTSGNVWRVSAGVRF